MLADFAPGSVVHRDTVCPLIFRAKESEPDPTVLDGRLIALGGVGKAAVWEPVAVFDGAVGGG